MSNAAHERIVVLRLEHHVCNFRIGDLDGWVIDDGTLRSGQPSMTHEGALAEEIERPLRNLGLPVDHLQLHGNLLLVRLNKLLVLFDTALGEWPDVPAWGGQAGRAAARFAETGISAEAIDVVILSHGHPEHIGGLIVDGAPAFPSAQIYISRQEFDFWTDPSRAGTEWDWEHAHALRTLQMLRERITFLPEEDEGEVIRGVRSLRTPGHTIDHRSFLIGAEGAGLWYMGDAARHHILNVEHHELRFKPEHNPAKAVRSRAALLGRAAEHGTAVASYHFPFPGIGYIDRIDGRFHFNAASTPPRPN